MIQVVFDASDRAVDYLFVDSNPGFERQTGMVDVIGRSMRTLAGDHEEHWFTIYGQFARTGLPTRFEAEAVALRRWFDVYAFRVGDPDEHLVAASRRANAQRVHPHPGRGPQLPAPAGGSRLVAIRWERRAGGTRVPASLREPVRVLEGSDLGRVATAAWQPALDCGHPRP